MNNIISYKQQIDTLQTKWNYEKSEAEKNSERTKEKLQGEINITVQKRNELEDKIKNSKDSLYGWLNQNKPGWENTIGKVIDEKLLFQDGLSPKLLNESSTLYGIQINLNDIEQKIKTIDDYRFELSKLNENIEQYQKDIQEVTSDLEKEQENIQRRNLPKIKALKERVRQAEYQCEQLKRQVEKSELEKNSFTNKAINEKLEAIEKIQIEIDKAIVLREGASETFEACKTKLRKSKESKQKEKTRRINELKAENQNKILELQQQIEEKRKLIVVKIESLKINRNKELDDKGADTERLLEIEKQITTVENELKFIEKQRDVVSEYNKDKRELFDKEKDFKNEIKGHEKKLDQNKNETAVLLSEFSKQIERIEKEIQETETKITNFRNDEEKYEDFIKSSAFKVMEDQGTIKPIESSKTAVQIIEEITEKYYLTKEKQDELKTSIDKFLSHFSEGNIFKFPSKLIGTEEYIN